MKRNPRLFLGDILASIMRIQEYTKGMSRNDSFKNPSGEGFARHSRKGISIFPPIDFFG